MPITLRRPIRKSFDKAWHTCVWCDSIGDSRRWPEHQLVERDAKYYCSYHYKWRFNYADVADAETEVPIEVYKEW